MYRRPAASKFAAKRMGEHGQLDGGDPSSSIAAAIGRAFARLLFAFLLVLALGVAAAPKTTAALVRSFRPQGFDLGLEGIHMVVGVCVIVVLFIAVPAMVSADDEDDDDDDSPGAKKNR